MPAFKWWVPNIIRKRKQIINKVKSKYWRISHKVGIKLPNTVDEELQIDRETGTDHWRCAINKEMARVKVTWIAREGCNPDYVREGKLRGQTTKALAAMTYSSVVLRDSIRLAFLILGLIDMDVMICVLQNAYLNAKCKEKI
eukprot:6339901-Ditylum_brightwellii.AAC.1